MEFEPWVDVNAVATHLGKAAWTVRELAKSGAIPGVKVLRSGGSSSP